MVFFTCSSCGESLKKAQVEKHRCSCRGCTCLSCIDCGKDFWGEDYKTHVRCISEDQKYGGKGFEAKANKGDVKQQQWIQRIQEAMNKPGVSSKLRDVLSQVSLYDNVPRKKAKFQNWMKSCLRIFDGHLQDQVWDILSATDSIQPNGAPHPESKPDPPPQPPQQQEQQEEEKPSEKKKNKRERKEERQKKNRKKHGENGSAEQDGQIASDDRQKKKKKRKRAEEEEEEEEEPQAKEVKSASKPKKKKQEVEENQSLEDTEDQQDVEDQSNIKGKFNWKGTIKAVLRQAPDDGLPVKKLRKKVLAAYYSFSGDANYRSEEELLSVFNKKINSPKFKVLKDKVRLGK